MSSSRKPRSNSRRGPWPVRTLVRAVAPVCCLLFAAPAPAQLLLPRAKPEPPLAPALATFDSKLDPAFRSGDFVGLAVAVVKNGEVVLQRGFGSRVAGEDLPVGADTRFRIASLSKGFAAGVALKLEEEGKLDLSTPVAEIAPGFRLARAAPPPRANVEAVLSHRLGLPPFAYDNLLEAHVPLPEIFRRLGEIRPLCPPGGCYGYQNVAFSLVEPAVERAAGLDFAGAVADRLFRPLGMRGASYGAEAMQADDDWARPHLRRDGRWQPSASLDDSYYRIPSAGGVNASIADLARWLAAQTGAMPQVLSPDTLARLHARRVATPAELRKIGRLRARVHRTWYALGWRVYDYAGEEVVMHNGAVDGYRAQIAFLPDYRFGMVALWNSTGSRGFALMPTLFDAFLGLDDPDWLRLECRGRPDDAAWCGATTELP